MFGHYFCEKADGTVEYRVQEFKLIPRPVDPNANQYGLKLNMKKNLPFDLDANLIPTVQAPTGSTI